MPRSFNGPVSIVLDCDKHIEESKQPALLFHPPTMEDELQLGQVVDQVEEAGTVEETKKLVCDALEKHYAGSKNYPGESFKSNIHLLNMREAVEVLTRLLYSSSLTSDEKKTSESLQPSDKGSLPADPALTAAASIAQQVDDRSTSSASTATAAGAAPVKVVEHSS